MRDGTGMARTQGGKLATIGATVLAAAAVAVAGCAAETAQATAAAFDRAAAVGQPAAAAPAAPAATVRALAPAHTPPARTLATGMTGADVKALQERLSSLKYFVGPVDGKFGGDTQAAIWAFQEINGVRVTGVVDAATKRALVRPRAYSSPSYPGKRTTRVEVSQALEVLVLFKGNQIELISHVSSGGGYYFCGSGGCARAVTPNGTYDTTVFMPGWVQVPLGEMYNPVFFIAAVFAIHGDTYVPAGPASHGCIRVPMDVSYVFHKMAGTPGTQVHVYGTPQWEG